MAYIALYRKYRPKNFDEIVGQEAIVRTLKNQLKSGKIGHAYLFCGMRGTGKTSTARVLAKALNCEHGPTDTPCNECKNCVGINDGSMMDVIEMDAASNRGIDDIRALRERVNFPPSEGRYRVYIIDEVHMLTTEAFNALLKTLEEPPRHAVFILATTEPNKLPATILSRCMRFDFKRVQVREMLPHLKRITEENGVEAEEKALLLVAKNSQGSMRDALSLLDKALSYGGNRLTFEDALSLFGAVGDDLLIEIARAAKNRNIGRILDVIEEVVNSGKDLGRFVDDLMNLYRNMLMVAIGANRDLVDVTDEEYGQLKDLAKIYSSEEILNSLDLLKKAATDVRWASQPRIVLEAAVVKLSMPQLWGEDRGYAARTRDLEQRVEALERKLEELLAGKDLSVNDRRKRAGEDESSAKTAEESGDQRTEAEPLKDGADEKAEPPEFESEKEKPTGELPISAAEEGERTVTSERKARQSADGGHQEEGELLEELQAKWQNVLEDLEKTGKMAIVNVMKECQVKPHDLKKGLLSLTFEGFEVYRSLIEKEKSAIKESIKRVTGLEVAIKSIKKKRSSSLEG